MDCARTKSGVLSESEINQPKSGAAKGSQPFRSEAKSKVIVGWLPSLTFAFGNLARMKKLILILSAVVVVLVGCVFWYRWDSETNHGYQFGYYGEFNRFGNALASISGITVTQAWANCDVTLEEFGFFAKMASGEPIRIAVGERDRIRSLSGALLVQALHSEIETQTKK